VLAILVLLVICPVLAALSFAAMYSDWFVRSFLLDWFPLLSLPGSAKIGLGVFVHLR